MHIGRSELRVSQMFVPLHFDIFGRTVTNATGWKHFWKIFVGETRAAWDLDPIPRLLFVHRKALN